MKQVCAAFSVFWVLWSAAAFASSVEETPAPLALPPVIVEGSAADVLLQDPIVPVVSGRPFSNSGTGAIDRSLMSELPMPLISNGTGELTSFRGLGRSAEDTNVQALGVPLNGPQGGGFDLSTFPQFLWSEFHWRPGPSLGAFDARSTAGTVTLVPWTQAALAESRPDRPGFAAARAWAQASGNDLYQVAGAARGDQAAVVAGYTQGSARGPSGALSVALGDREARSRGSFHLLATRWDAEVAGSRSDPTPNARQLTARGIPVLQWDLRLGESSFVKSTFYADGTYLRASNPDGYAYETADRVWQWGGESAISTGNWQFGVAARTTAYRSMNLLTDADFRAPREVAGNVRASRVFESAGLRLEPVVQVVAVSGYGARLAGSVGVRRDWDSGASTYIRVARAYRFPTLTQRYYEMPGYARGNPDLLPEQSWSAVPGFAFEGSKFKASLEGYAQFASDAQISASEGGVQVVRNRGNARVMALTPQLSWKPLPGVTVRESLTWSYSRVESSGLRYPFLPAVTQVTQLSFAQARWEGGATFRAASRATTGTQDVSGYGYLDLSAQFRLFKSENRASGVRRLTLMGRVDNVLDRAIELFPDYPLPGRILSVGIAGEF